MQTKLRKRTPSGSRKRARNWSWLLIWECVNTEFVFARVQTGFCQGGLSRAECLQAQRALTVYYICYKFCSLLLGIWCPAVQKVCIPCGADEGQVRYFHS